MDESRDPYRTIYDAHNEKKNKYEKQGFRVVALPENLAVGQKIKDFVVNAGAFMIEAKKTILIFRGQFYKPSGGQYPEDQIRDRGFAWVAVDENCSEPTYLEINDQGTVRRIHD